ncbi:hypothetical protein CC80DRAFT_424773 [Byssothecium circinans]|uniref:RING-type domain-containing protein n=1 Tax=Byssothecium circinans TaxID=147558 RepID=A0A6A5TF85_9PLEO|nr:hypothetical protein CC80DRAFT_424773 [Byssothecium circinans]
MDGHIVNLVSDDEYDSDFSFEPQDAHFNAFADEHLHHHRVVANDADRADDSEFIDLTSLADIPDLDMPEDPGPAVPVAVNAAPVSIDNEPVTEAECLQMVLNVLPDVSVQHVLTLINGAARTPTTCQRIILQLLDGDVYPKEQDEVDSRKRKRESDDYEGLEPSEHDARAISYSKDALELLKDEFLSVPVRHLENVLEDNKTFFKSYGVLSKQLRTYQNIAPNPQGFTKIRTPRQKRYMINTLIDRGSQIPKELEAARKRDDMETSKRRRAEELERAEQANLREAQRLGEMGECQCCFDDIPINRMTSCSGETVHFFCLSCASKYVEGEMGLGRVKVVCFADPNCVGTFTRRQLQEFLSETSFERLEHMQQLEDLAAAGLDFLSECPFCDYKAECPPVDVDKEFRCQNPKCRKVSCRLCQKETHIPLSCKEVKDEDKLSARHGVEEAMSAALIRHCNKCKHPFIKLAGCNKMACTRCGNVQCYVCSKDVRDYHHFSDGSGDPRGSSKCPLHDNVEARHEEEVKKAAAEARAKVQAENPNISEADLTIQVSDRVKQAEQSRQGRAQADHVRFPYHMAGGALVNAPAPQPPPVVGREGQVLREFPNIFMPFHGPGPLPRQ